MSDDIKKGLLGITVDETEVSKVMTEINSLNYIKLSTGPFVLQVYCMGFRLYEL